MYRLQPGSRKWNRVSIWHIFPLIYRALSGVVNRMLAVVQQSRPYAFLLMYPTYRLF